MSTNRNVANLATTMVKTLVKMAGFGRVADMIDGSQECLNLLADIKNDALGNPNAEMIRSLNGAVKSEFDAIQDALQHNGLGRKQVKQAAAQLAEAARETINDLTEDDNALIRAVQQPQCFAEQLRGHTAPLPNLSSDEMQAHYETLLDRIAEEFLSLAPWSPNFDHVALTELLRCFPALTDQIARVEHEIQEVADKVDAESERSREADADTHRKLDDLKDMVGSFTPTERKPLRVVFASRPDVVAGDRFVERNEHKQLKTLITDPTRKRTVLLGMRGCGKTQLAASLAEQCEEANWNLVAWINAVSRKSIQSDLVELAKRLKIDTSDQPAQDVIVRRCLDHLKSAAPTDRLIVFDNVEDINHLTGLIPSGDGLRVVATTTNKVGWEDQGWNSIEVGGLDRSDSIKYLLKVANSDDRDAADTLAERLDDLPLALAQAAATAHNGDLSLARYLDRLDSYGSERTIRPVPGDYYTHDVATALCMAIKDALDNLADATRQSARRQLGALALLAESGVPTRWLDPTIEQQDNQDLQGANKAEDEDAHDALTELIHRSIVQQSADKATTMLHRLQAQVFRESWDEKETAEAYESSTMLLSNVNIDRFPRNDTDSRRRETRDLIEQLHAIGEQKYARNIFTHENVPVRVFQALSNAHDLALFSEALTLEASINTIQEILGPEHPGTLAASNNLAHAYEAAGYFHDAIGMYEQVLADHTRVFGASHPYTLTIANNLAGAYESGGYFDKAINLYRQVLANRLRALGPDHPDVLTTRNDLAYAYASAGQFSEAISMFQLVLKDRLRILGPDHPDTIHSRNNLAYAYASAGDPLKGLELYLQVFTEYARTLGPYHRYTLASRKNIADLYASAGLLNAAVPLYEDVLSDYQRILGLEHPLTKTVRENFEAAKRELEQQEEDLAAE